MTYVPHIRLTWAGTLPNGEIFSNSLSMVPDNSVWEQAVTTVAQLAILTNVLTNVNLTDDIVADVVNYHTRAASMISAGAVLKRVTLAGLDADGHYVGAAREAAVNSPGGEAQVSYQSPHQIARKVTLETDDDLGRVKGGWFIPLPSLRDWDQTTNLWGATNTSGVRDSVKQFLDDLEDAPGLDANSFRVVVASQGRHNKNGSVRMPPRNCDVKRVNVGRRLDVQRRRANKISEARITDAVLG